MVNMVSKKRFLFSIIAVICASVVAVILKFDGELYLKCLLVIAGPYQAAQTITDIRNGNKHN